MRRQVNRGSHYLAKRLPSEHIHASASGGPVLKRYRPTQRP